ncbi:TPA: type 1 fimbrial protein [Providencia rettgeri]|uniref:fimbrial protein n=1 Tax=Providencia rettgeri TaxID=587 RepID=UPI00068E7360|nr:fimbrial protein [Providencia rettgeri]EJD6672742.1 type 1 fimbrial protein [Providencia rettgeri]HEM7509595.1 type 1 fimbrial protein [Providencia rettgeri]HEM8269625.1 type 1 fimbrial protein [Providencia rettgeri]
MQRNIMSGIGKFMWVGMLFLYHTPSTADLARINIRISANLVKDSCQVDVASKSKVVNLGDWSANQFTPGNNYSSPAKEFTIGLANCASTINNMKIRFSGNVNAQDSTLFALNTSSTASNIGVAILDEQSQRITPGQRVNTAIHKGSNGTITLKFLAQYIATSPSITPGNANSQALFELEYL